MSSSQLTSLLAVLLAAVLAPMVAHALRRAIRVPSVVLEILLGVLVGPALLGWVKLDTFLTAASDLGLSMLLFMAGYEIEFSRIRGRPIKRAAIGWGGSLVIGLALGALLAGFTMRAQVVGLALTTTALGTILPMLRDAGALPTSFGARVLAVGAFGEFGPIVAIALVFSERHPIDTIMVIILFTMIAAGVMALADRPRRPTVARLITTTLDTSVQFAVRLVVLVLVAMLCLADAFDLDILLGAFVAGLVVRLALDCGDPVEERAVAAKLDAVGFGFLIPVFFVLSGARMDVEALVRDPGKLLLIPFTLVAYLICRGAPTYLLDRDPPLALFASAALPLVVVITSTGVELGVLDSATAAAMVVAGVLSVLTYPLMGLRILCSRMEGSPA